MEAISLRSAPVLLIVHPQILEAKPEEDLPADFRQREVFFHRSDDRKLTWHHPIPRSRGGRKQARIRVPWGKHRRWHAIFENATPEDAIRNILWYYNRCMVSPVHGSSIFWIDQHGRVRKPKRRKVKAATYASCNEAWRYLFGAFSIDQVVAMIMREWTYQGIVSYAQQEAILPSLKAKKRAKRQRRMVRKHAA